MNLARSWASPGSTFVRWLIGLAPWLLAVSIVVVVVHRLDRADTIELLRDGPRAAATVVSASDGEVNLEYDHVVVGSVTAALRDDRLGIGERVNVVYDRDDPYRVVLTTARPQPDPVVVVTGLALLAAVVTIGASQWTARRARRLAAEESTAFRMLASIHRSRWSVVPRLSLYPLDSAGGDRSVCTIRLADIRTPGREDVCDEVEVKGLPRPGGRVVVRRGDVILWPRGRALVTTRHQRPGPTALHPPQFDPSTDQPSPGPTSSLPNLAGDVDEVGDHHPLRVLRWIAGVAAAGVVITLVVAAITITNGRATDRWTAAGRPGVATIADRDHDDFGVAVDVALDGEPGAARSMVAPVDFPDEYEQGRVYPAVVSADLSHVRLLAEPYDRVEPILSFAIPTAVVLWHLARRALGG